MKQVAEEKVVAEVEECRRVAEAEACQIMEEKVVVAVRQQAILDVEARRKAEAEEAVADLDDRLLSKQKERVEGEPVVCDHCAMRGVECQVSDFILDVFSVADAR